MQTKFANILEYYGIQLYSNLCILMQRFSNNVSNLLFRLRWFIQPLQQHVIILYIHIYTHTRLRHESAPVQLYQYSVFLDWVLAASESQLTRCSEPVSGEARCSWTAAPGKAACRRREYAEMIRGMRTYSSGTCSTQTQTKNRVEK